MVSTLESTNLDTPITPANIKLNTSGVENTLSLYTTPEVDGERDENEPKTPQKELLSSKKKSHRIGSKRKLFLQSGSTGTPNKVKKISNSSVPKPKKSAATPVVTSPTVKGAASSTSGKEGTWSGSYPLTERQQLQYLLEVTAKEAQKEPQESESDDNQGQMFTRLKKKDVIKKEANALRISKRNERGETLLHLAAIKGDIDETISLIKAGLSVNVKDYAGWTPLHEACNFGHLNIVDELLKGGANVNVPGYEEISPLHDAVINNHVQVVELLLRYGADPEQTTMQGYTSIDLARSATILELLQSVRPSKTTASPQTDSSSTTTEKSQDSNELVNQVNPVKKESKLTSDKGYASDHSQGSYNQVSPQKFTFVRSGNFDQNLYSRRSSCSSSSQVSDIDDSIDPKRLNECLDKAMLEMSSYLDPQENSYPFLNQGFQKSNQSVLGNLGGPVTTPRGKTTEVNELGSEQNLENQPISLNGQCNIVSGNKNVLKDNVFLEGEVPLSSDVSKNSMKQDNELQKFDNKNCLISKTPSAEEGHSNKENQLSHKTRLHLDTNITNQSSSNTKLDGPKASEVTTVVQDCIGHIKNPTWRKAIEKNYYSVSSLPLYVPGYKKFMMSTKSYTLQTQDDISSSLPFGGENEEETELSRLKTAQLVEREKLRLCLEQEIVRLFGSFARRAIEKSVPIGACTILQQQMKTHGREKSNAKKDVDKLSSQTIKADVEQILQKFEKMKVKLLNRQRHEVDAIIALQQLSQGKTGVFTSEITQQQNDLKVEDFELMPAGFREYYEEFLSLID